LLALASTTLTTTYKCLSLISQVQKKLDLSLRVKHVPHPKNHESQKICVINQGEAYASLKKLKLKKEEDF
jgi:hypothetical protein